MRLQSFFVAALLVVATSCSKGLHPLKADTSYYNMSGAMEADSTILKFVQPYHDSLAKEMQVTVATSAMVMDKGRPESLMGNFIADLLLEKGKEYNNGDADFSIMNYGGLRIPSLPKGEVTKGIIYELMPFDNFLVIMKLNGNVVQQMLDYIASQGGWPVAGLKFKIRDGKAFDILINNLPLQPDKIYSVVISDYLADGGDNLAMLKTEERKNFGIFVRDVILEYMKEQTQEGKMISSKLDGRISVE